MLLGERRRLEEKRKRGYDWTVNSKESGVFWGTDEWDDGTED